MTISVKDLSEALSRYEPTARVEILTKPLTGQMAIGIVREPWDDNIILYES